MDEEFRKQVLAVLEPIDAWKFHICSLKELPLRWLVAHHKTSLISVTIRYSFFRHCQFQLDHLPDDPTCEDLQAIDDLHKHRELFKSAILMREPGIIKNQKTYEKLTLPSGHVVNIIDKVNVQARILYWYYNPARENAWTGSYHDELFGKTLD